MARFRTLMLLVMIGITGFTVAGCVARVRPHHTTVVVP